MIIKIEVQRWFVTTFNMHDYDSPIPLSFIVPPISLLLELTFLPCMLLFLALPWKVVVVFSALHERDEQVSTVVSQVKGNFGLRHLLSSHLHL